jgi:hypothetical protein
LASEALLKFITQILLQITSGNSPLAANVAAQLILRCGIKILSLHEAYLLRKTINYNTTAFLLLISWLAELTYGLALGF